MKTHKKNQREDRLLFLVLVPHRDSRLVLRKWSDSLFKAGFSGAYSFPWVAPLALLSRPFSAEELKNCAMRGESTSVNNGKISATAVSSSVMPAFHSSCSEGEVVSIFGPCLDFDLPNGLISNEKVISLFSPIIIGACILQPGGNKQAENAALPPLPQISFRAAAIANMSWQPLQAGNHAANEPEAAFGSYKWKIGKLSWLPPVH